MSAPTKKSPRELEREKKMIEIWTQQAEIQFHCIGDETFCKQCIANYVKDTKEKEEAKQAFTKKVEERERAIDKENNSQRELSQKSTGVLDCWDRMRAIWTEKAENEFSAVPNQEFK